MMKINLEHIGRRFNREWIFRDVNYVFESGSSYAILGANGAGKSTILQVISGSLSSSEGTISYTREGVLLNPEHVFEHLSMAAPYLELIEEFTLEESIRFHSKLKPLLPGFTPASLYELLALPRTRQKEIRFFSSGMKQRLKLALAVCSDTPILLLDEPATNLDVQGVEWYKNLISEYAAKRLVIIASNDPHDAAFCEHHLNILEFKK